MQPNPTSQFTFLVGLVQQIVIQMSFSFVVPCLKTSGICLPIEALGRVGASRPHYQ